MPAVENVTVYEFPVPISALPLKAPALSGVTVCCSVSALVHVTESPTLTMMVGGANAKFEIATVCTAARTEPVPRSSAAARATAGASAPDTARRDQRT